MTALITRSPLRLPRWRSALLASCVAACAGSGVCAYAYPDSRPAHSGDIVAVDVTTPAAAYSSAEQASIPGGGLNEESHLAIYLRAHYANEHGVIPLYPLAAFVASTRRADPESRGSHRDGRYAYTRRGGVGAAVHARQVR